MLLDNKGQGKVGDALGKSIQADARLSVVSGLFSIYGYAVLNGNFRYNSFLIFPKSLMRSDLLKSNFLLEIF